jgi:hypothetical protein
MNGRLVRQSVLKTNAAGESMIAIHDLKPGVYNVELSGMNFSSVKKFIISDGHAH